MLYLLKINRWNCTLSKYSFWNKISVKDTNTSYFVCMHAMCAFLAMGHSPSHLPFLHFKDQDSITCSLVHCTRKEGYNFFLDPSGTYITYTDTNVLNVYQINQGTICTSGQYYNLALPGCDACPIGCATCASSTVCSSCLPNYIFSGNLCVINNSPSVINTSTNL